MMLCQHCNGQMLRQQELGEEPFSKCLQCARAVYASAPQPALRISGLLPRMAEAGAIAITAHVSHPSRDSRSALRRSA